MARERVTILLDAKDRASREIRGAEGALGKLKAAGRAATIVLAALGTAAVAAGAAFVKLADRGGDVVNVQRAFNNVLPDGERALQSLRAATHGLISDYDLMVQANRAVTLGSAQNTEQLSQLAGTAVALGRALGVDAAYALESLSLGIGRQSRLLLDNLGIIVSVEEANRRYAAAIGVSVGQLSDAQRQEAFRTAALEAAEQKIESLGGVVLTNADRWDRFTTRLTNARDAMAEWVATSPEAAEFFSTLETALDALLERLPQITDYFTRLAQGAERVFLGTSNLAEGARARMEVDAAVSTANVMGERGDEFLMRRFAQAAAENASAQAALEPGARPAGEVLTVEQRRQLEEEARVRQRVVDLLREELAARARPPGTGSTESAAPGVPLPTPQIGLYGEVTTPITAWAARQGLGAPEDLLVRDPFLPGRVEARNQYDPAAFLAGVQRAGVDTREEFAALDQDQQDAIRAAMSAIGQDFDDVFGAVQTESERAAVVAVGAFQAVATAAIRGGQSIEQYLIPAIANIVSNLPGVGNIAGAVIGAVGGIATALFGGGRDNDAVPVRIRDVDDNAAAKLKNRDPDVQLYLNGQRATSAEEQRILGYQLDRISRLQGESTTGV